MALQRLPSGRLITSNTPLTFLIAWAYGLDDGRLLGAPKGADSARFDIVAQPPGGPPAPGQLHLMMQRLLADRFRLAVHRETRELVTYTLVTISGGPKVRAVPPTEPTSANPFNMSAAGVLTGTRVTSDMLATVLSSQLGRPVENQTGITGVFDFTLTWRPDSAAAPDDGRASLFTAIREQLGLHLDARRSPVDVIVIDHVELRPTEN